MLPFGDVVSVCNGLVSLFFAVLQSFNPTSHQLGSIENQKDSTTRQKKRTARPVPKTEKCGSEAEGNAWDQGWAGDSVRRNEVQWRQFNIGQVHGAAELAKSDAAVVDEAVRPRLDSIEGSCSEDQVILGSQSNLQTHDNLVIE